MAFSLTSHGRNFSMIREIPTLSTITPPNSKKTQRICKKVVLQDGKSERLTVRAGSNTTSVQDALTEYRVIESCPQGYAWLELFPLTGRKHQLRVHCAEVLGTPIVLLGITSMDDKCTRTGCLFPCRKQLMRNCSRNGGFPLGLLWVVEALRSSSRSCIYTASR